MIHDNTNQYINNNETQDGNIVRKISTEYFMQPEGQVPWQEEYVSRGLYRDVQWW